MTRYEGTENKYSDAWIWLVLLLVIGFIIWRLFSALAAFGIALFGLIILVIIRTKGKKRSGDYIEVSDKSLTIGQNGQHFCITFNEIKKIKTSRIFSLLGEPAFVIETSTGTKRWLQPDDYENGQQLREQLNKRFEEFNLC